MSPLYVVCVARHEYLATHLARFFESAEVCTVGAVGVQGAVESTRSCAPDVVVCEYEWLTTQPLDDWEADEVLRYAPIVAVSLTRQSNEMVPLDCNGIAGFLYLPTLAPDRRAQATARGRRAPALHARRNEFCRHSVGHGIGGRSALTARAESTR